MARQRTSTRAKPCVRAGVTLAETLVATALLGMLAAVAMGRFDSAKEPSYVAAMQNDLRNYAALQSERWHKEFRFADGAKALAGDFTFSADVRARFAANTDERWILSVEHARTDVVCTLRYGDDSELERLLICDRNPPQPPTPVASFVIQSFLDDFVVQDFGTTFDGTASLGRGGGAVTDWQWDFGDGTTATGPTPSKMFTKPGLYEVSLRVTNEAGWEDTVVRTIEVRRQWLLSPDDLTHAAWLKNQGVTVDGNFITFTRPNAYIEQHVAGVPDPGNNGNEWGQFTLTGEFENYTVEKADATQTLRFTVRARGAPGTRFRMLLDWNKDCGNCALYELNTRIAPHGGGTTKIEIEYAFAYFIED